MAPPATFTSKLKVPLRMSIQRLRMLQTKQTAIAKQNRRTMAELVGEGKLESARIRTESIIRSDITTELHEILELYTELLLARIGLLEPDKSGLLTKKDGDEQNKEILAQDPGLEEAIRAIVFAAQRIDVKEVTQARNLLVEKFGKDFALECIEGQGVPERVIKRVRVETPKPELVDAYLREICRAYGVRFPGDPVSGDEEEVEEEADDDDGEGGAKELEEPLQAEGLSKAVPPKEEIGDSPLRIAPPSPSTENVAPKITMPDGKKKAAPKPSLKTRKSSTGGAATKKDAPAGGDGPGGKIPDVDELAKRFAALKKG